MLVETSRGRKEKNRKGVRNLRPPVELSNEGRNRGI